VGYKSRGRADASPVSDHAYCTILFKIGYFIALLLQLVQPFADQEFLGCHTNSAGAQSDWIVVGFIGLSGLGFEPLTAAKEPKLPAAWLICSRPLRLWDRIARYGQRAGVDPCESLVSGAHRPTSLPARCSQRSSCAATSPVAPRQHQTLARAFLSVANR